MRTETINVNNQTEQKYKKPGVLACTGGVLAGTTVQGLSNVPHLIVAPKLMERFKGISRLADDELIKVTKGIDTTLASTGLSGKGVKILRSTAGNQAEITSAIAQEMNRSRMFLPKQIRELLGNSMNMQVKMGNNAFYTFGAKKIIMPAKDLALSAFHEMGHAANANLSTVGKLLQKCRPLTMLAIPIGLIALWKTKKAPNEEAKGSLDKATDFVKNNAGKLTFLSFVPMLAEEAMASVKGVNFAKKVLDPSLVTKVAKTNKIAYLTYLGIAASAAAGIALGVKVKDSIAKPKPVNQ